MTPFRKYLFVGIFIIGLVLLAACGGPEEVAVVPTATATVQPTATATLEPTATETPLPTDIPTLEPTDTATPLPTDTPMPDPTATATPAPIVLDDFVVVEVGGYAFRPVVDYIVEVNEHQASLFREDDELLFFMLSGPANPGTLLEDVLDEFLQTVDFEMVSDESYPFVIDAQEGIARDITGVIFDNDIEGVVAVVYATESDIFMIVGYAQNEQWTDEGTAVFEAVVDSITFSLEDLASEDEADAPSEETPSDDESEFLLPLPTGDPVAEWNGLPIMPQAIAGEESEGSYAFTVAASNNEVQQFYAQEMEALGWESLAVGEGETGAVLMIFQMDDAVASISILAVDDNTLYVFLVK